MYMAFLSFLVPGKNEKLMDLWIRAFLLGRARGERHSTVCIPFERRETEERTCSGREVAFGISRRRILMLEKCSEFLRLYSWRA